MRTLQQMLKDNKTLKNITLFFDIETYQYNEDQGSINPSSYKNMTYSVAVSWLDNKNVEYEILPDFKTMFDIIINEIYM